MPSSINILGGGLRLNDYNVYFSSRKRARNMPVEIKALKDVERIGTCILACMKIPEQTLDISYLSGLMLMLECTFTAKMWMFKPRTMGSPTPHSIWPKEDLEWQGLCVSSCLNEAHKARTGDIFSAEFQDGLLAEQLVERKQKEKDYRQSEKGQAKISHLTTIKVFFYLHYIVLSPSSELHPL
jgi:hypothetical protein